MMATIPFMLLFLSIFGLMYNVQRSRHMRLLQSLLPRADNQSAKKRDGAGHSGVVLNSAAGCLLTIVRQLMQGKFGLGDEGPEGRVWGTNGWIS